MDQRSGWVETWRSSQQAIREPRAWDRTKARGRTGRGAAGCRAVLQKTARAAGGSDRRESVVGSQQRRSAAYREVPLGLQLAATFEGDGSDLPIEH